MEEEALYLGDRDNIFFVKAVGHVTARLCGDLKKQVSARFASNLPPTAFFVDLEYCTYMDSTFIGLLVSFSKVLLKKGNTKVVLLHVHETCKKLLESLGVVPLFAFESEDIKPPSDYFKISGVEAASAEILLAAHEELMGISQENRSKFAGLQAVLKKQLGNAGRE